MTIHLLERIHEELQGLECKVPFAVGFWLVISLCSSASNFNVLIEVDNAFFNAIIIVAALHYCYAAY